MINYQSVNWKKSSNMSLHIADLKSPHKSTGFSSGRTTSPQIFKPYIFLSLPLMHLCWTASISTQVPCMYISSDFHDWRASLAITPWTISMLWQRQDPAFSELQLRKRLKALWYHYVNYLITHISLQHFFGVFKLQKKHPNTNRHTKPKTCDK